MALAVRDPSYLAALPQSRAALLRRNAARRSAAVSGGADAVAVWEPALAQYGAALWRERRAWVVSMEDRLETLCREIGEGGGVRMRYASTLAAGDDPRAELPRPLAENEPPTSGGFTHVGPHRDDLVVTLDGRLARVRSAAQRTAAIALRMLEAATVTERRGPRRCSLDDPFAEPRAAVGANPVAVEREGMGVEGGVGQTVIAVPRDSDIPAELTGLERFRIAAGVVTSANAA